MEMELEDYQNFFGKIREDMQSGQLDLVKARLNNQYFLQLLAENQVLLMRNQRKLMVRFQRLFFKQEKQRYKEERIAKVENQTINRKLGRNYNIRKTLINSLNDFPDYKYSTFE